MTNAEKLEEVIKETFPDIFENEPSFKVATDICDIIRCDDRDCLSCYLNHAGIDRPYELQEYKGSSNSKSSNPTAAITSSGIAW